MYNEERYMNDNMEIKGRAEKITSAADDIDIGTINTTLSSYRISSKNSALLIIRHSLPND